MAITDPPYPWHSVPFLDEVYGNRAAPGTVLNGWQCPGCKRCYSPTWTMCSFCPVPGSADAVNFIARGHLGTPCPRPKDGGMCGCDEDDDTPKVCLGRECDC